MRIFVKNILLFVLLLVASCTHSITSIQAKTADSLAISANVALPVLIQVYREQGNVAIDNAKTEQEARVAIAKIEAQWMPVWDAWRVLKSAHESYATILESGGDSAVALHELRVAYCSLIHVWPQDVPISPIAAISCNTTPSLSLSTEID